MTGGMTIEKAREIVEHPEKFADLSLSHMIFDNAKGFVEGYESREGEVKGLKSKCFELEGKLLSSEASYSALLKIKEKVRCPMCGETK